MSVVKAKRRDYRAPDGTRLPSVTDVLSAQLGWRTDRLVDWAHNLGRLGQSWRAARQERADAGSYAHALVEAALTGAEAETPPLPADDLIGAERAAASFLGWWKGSGLRLVAIEVPCVSALGFGGTPDLIAMDDVGLVIVDLKTGSQAHDEAILQLAGYGLLWTSVHGGVVSRGVIVHARLDGSCAVHEVTREQLAIGATAFAGLLFLHQQRDALRLRRSA